jgi:PTH1 family peptidyl-tRNA hydrolase
VDLLLERFRGTWSLERRFEALTGEIRIADQRLTLMKPLTYMNLSGKSVAAYLSKNGGEPEDVLAISDDINLLLGQIRLRSGGSHGGHKGLLSIINSLGSLDYPRIRIGVKPDGARISDWVGFVLSRMTPREREALELAEQNAADAVEMIIGKGFAAAMNHYNRKQPPLPE